MRDVIALLIILLILIALTKSPEELGGWAANIQSAYQKGVSGND